MQDVLHMLDTVLGARSNEQLAREQEERDHRRLVSLGFFLPAELGTGVETRGCPRCGSTMYRTYETDDRGNVTSQSQFVCNNCGNVA